MHEQKGLPEDGYNRHRFGDLSRRALVRPVCLHANRLRRQCRRRFIAAQNNTKAGVMHVVRLRG